jgi:hypothetical protein
MRRTMRRGETSRCAAKTTSDLSMNVDQFRSGDEFGADGAVVLVGASSLGVGPGKTPADGWIIWFGVNDADVVAKEDAAAATYSCPPLAPSGAIGHAVTVNPDEGERFLLTQGDTVSTARGMMRARVTRQRWKLVHAGN